MFGKYSEEMFFEGDQSALNPARYLPTPYHTKLAQQRTALSQYIQQEAVGTRMRRWERPIHDFLAPYFRGMVERVTGEHVISKEVEHRRDLETLADMLKYLRAESEAAADPRTGLSRLRPFAALPPVCHHRNPLPFSGRQGHEPRLWPALHRSAGLAVCSPEIRVSLPASTGLQESAQLRSS